MKSIKELKEVEKKAKELDVKDWSKNNKWTGYKFWIFNHDILPEEEFRLKSFVKAVEIQSIKKRDEEWKKEITKWAKKQKTFRLYDNKLRKGFNSQYPVVFFNDLMSVLNTISKQDKPI